MSEESTCQQNNLRHFFKESGKEGFVHSLKNLEKHTGKSVERLPYSIRVLLENMVRYCGYGQVVEADIKKVLDWQAHDDNRPEIPFKPARVVMQDFTGVPAVVDLASMRDAVRKAGGDPAKINPQVGTALVVDHSVQVDFFGTKDSFQKNVDLEFERNSERYKLLKWGQKAFDNFQVVPPGMGIIHQINLEYLSPVVLENIQDSQTVWYPDSVVGTDSHTTMINGLGVLGWGVGGIEAEAALLGQPCYMVLPDVVGMKLTGKLKEGVVATDLVLRITQELRKFGVVNKFVEFFGEGVKSLPLSNRATIANMAPEYGATMGYFPIDAETVNYLQSSNRKQAADRVELVMREMMLYRENASEQPEYSAVIELDLSTVDSTLAGPKRPQDRVPLRKMKSDFQETLNNPLGHKGFAIDPSKQHQKVAIEGMNAELAHGSVVIAAITSCTNTSNPYVMLGAGLLAKKAVEKGLDVKPFVKTSLAPGSQVVTEYLKRAGLLSYLEKLKFDVVGYGCTTCIGNSGNLPDSVIKAIQTGDLVAAAVLSGNRNFEGRINPYVRANYLASPIHVVAYALAGTVNFDPEQDPIGKDQKGQPVYLKDIWPSNEEISKIVDAVLTPELYEERYKTVFDGTVDWQKLAIPTGELYQFDSDSTYIQCPPFFENFATFKGQEDIKSARTLLVLGDSTTTDHISPAGNIPEAYPAGQYLKLHGVDKKDFNSYGARRGNHEVMMRGTFANTRLHNLLLPGVEGGFTRYHPTGEQMYVFDAAMKYKETHTPLVILAGKEYGTGSSRDWAAKGTLLLGVRAVIAESYERIHRSNLVFMGVLPLQYQEGESAQSLGLNGAESFTILGVSKLKVGQIVEVEAKKTSGSVIKFKAKTRLDTEFDVQYFNNGGILQTVLINLMK